MAPQQSLPPGSPSQPRNLQALRGQAISGVSLLTTPARLYEAEELSYRQLRSVVAFAEAYVLHEGLTVVGPVASEDEARVQRFIDQLNGRRPGFIQVLERDGLRIIEDPGVQVRLRRLTDQVLGERLYLDPVALLSKAVRYRHFDDADEAFQGALALALRSTNPSAALATLVVQTYRDGRTEGFGAHLARGFLYAAIAGEAGASALFDGNRQVVAHLLTRHGEDVAIECTALRVYRAMDAVVLMHQAPLDAGGIHLPMRVPLLLWEVYDVLKRHRHADPEWRLKQLLDALDEIRGHWHRLLAYGRGMDQQRGRFPKASATAVQQAATEKAAVRTARQSAHSKSERASWLLKALVHAPEFVFKAEPTSPQRGASSADVSGGASAELKLPVRLLVNVLLMWAPTPRRRALKPLAKAVVRSFGQNRPCDWVFRFFRVRTTARDGRAAPTNRADLEAFEALALEEAKLRFNR